MQITIGANESFDWVRNVTPFLSVVLGALLAYNATRLSERRKERVERIASATMMTLKIRTVVDGIFKIDRQLNEGMARALAAGVSGPRWAMMERISAIGDYEETLTAEDMSPLSYFGEFDLIQTITEMRDGHNSVIRALVQFFDLRDEMAIVMPPNQVVNNVALYAGTPPPKALIILANLDTLSASILNAVEGLKKQAMEFAPAFHAALKKNLRVKKFPQIVLP